MGKKRPAAFCFFPQKQSFVAMRGIRLCWRWAALWLVSFLMFSPRCGAIQFDVFIGYGGVVREVGWFPVSCEVENDGPAFTGTIEIAKAHFGTKAKQRYRIILELPTNTRKRITFPLFHSGGFPSWNAKLYDENGEVRKEWKGDATKEVAWEGVIMGSVSRTIASAPQFPQFQKSNSKLQPQVGRIYKPEQFPDTQIALESLSSLYLNSEQALHFTQKQAGALSSWVAFGGHLFLAIESPTDVLATEWLQPLCPFRPEGFGRVLAGDSFQKWLADDSPQSLPSKTISGAMGNLLDSAIDSSSSSRPLNSPTIPSPNSSPRRPRNAPPIPSSPLPGSRADFKVSFDYSKILEKHRAKNEIFENETMPIVTGQRLDGEVLLAAEGFPLIITAPRGRGQVTVLTFSPEREPFLSWENKNWFWAKLNRIAPEWFGDWKLNHYGGLSLDGAFRSLIESRQIRKLPVSWLLLLLAVYLAVIGPFDYWCLKKVNRQMLTWATFPAYVVLFSLLIYFIGYRLRAGDTEWNELHIVDAVPKGQTDQLRGRSYMAVYSPANAEYKVRCPLPNSTFRSQFLGPNRGGQEAGKSNTLLNASFGVKARISVPVWMNQLHVADWTHTAPSPFAARLVEHSPNKIAVRLENRGTQAIEAIGIAAKGRFLRIEGLAPGESRTEHLSPHSGQTMRQFVRQEGAHYSNALKSLQQHLGDTLRIDGVERHSMVFTFISLWEEYRSARHNHGGRDILFPNGMELSPVAERGDVVVLAYCPDLSLLPWLNEFPAVRKNRGTLIRLTLSQNTTDQ